MSYPSIDEHYQPKFGKVQMIKLVECGAKSHKENNLVFN